MKTLWQDLRYGWRVLAKAPGFTMVAVLTLALGIGANTAISTVVYGVLFRPLPFPQSDRIVQLAETFEGQPGEMDVTARQLQRLREYGQHFERIAGYTDVGFNVAAGNEAEHVRGMPVSAEYFQVLGVHPAAGRDFLLEEDRGDGQRVAVISHALWLRRFAGDPGTIGHEVLFNGDPYTVIGVMPDGFEPRANSEFNSGIAVDVWVPLALVAKTVGSGENIGVVARLKPGVTRAQVEAQMSLVTQEFRKEFPDDVSARQSMGFLPYQFMIGADVRPYLLVLLGAIGFVLLIACANVANLLLARGGSRGREIAVRLAMGATRARLVQQLLSESILIALAGGVLGFAVANAGLGSLLTMAPVSLPRLSDIRLDGWIFGFTLLVSVLTGLLFGLAPAVYTTNATLSEALKEGAGKASAGAGRARLRQGLVMGEFALSLVLLTGAGLMIATFAKLLNTNPGFDPHRVLTMQFWLNGSTYNTTPEVTNYYRSVVQRIESLPGVEAAGIVAAGLPLERGGNNGVRIAGSHESAWLASNYREVSAGYFRAMGIALREGRGILESDTESSNQVVVINEAFAQKYLAGRSALGEHVYVNRVPREVVGVVADVKSYLDRPAPPATFIPAAQVSYETSRIFEGWFPRSIAVRTNLDPLRLSRAVREAVVAVDPLVPAGRILSMDQLLSRSLALRSFMMLLLSVFGGLALLLASVGIYGVISYAVSQRTREIGVRMALGARPADVSRMILTEGLKLVLGGVVLGVGAALLLTRLLEGMLYGVSMRDPLIFVLVNLLLVGVSLVASYVPARRAMRVDPIVALRYE
jgi:putative ABC transport system permease protein